MDLKKIKKFFSIFKLMKTIEDKDAILVLLKKTSELFNKTSFPIL